VVAVAIRARNGNRTLPRHGIDSARRDADRPRAVADIRSDGKPVTQVNAIDRSGSRAGVRRGPHYSHCTCVAQAAEGGMCSCKLPNDLVRTNQHRRWDSEVQRPRSLQIDHQLKLSRLLDREIGGFRTTEDAVDIVGSSAG